MEFNDVRLRYEALQSSIDSAVAEVLRSGRYILARHVQSFEEDFAKYCGTANGIGVASGTDALTIGLRAIGVEAGDDVLVPAVSAPATAMAVALTGARPVFVDIQPDSFNMDPAVAFERKTSRARAVVPVHLYGMPAQLKKLSGIGLPVLEDAAQAHGSEANWGKCGSFGVAAAFSFYPTKNLGTYGDGGIIVTSDSGVAERARLLRNYGQTENYSSKVIGQNSRLDELHAAILRAQLRKLDEWNARRRKIASVYREQFKDLPVGLQMETGKSNYHLFVVTTANRDRLRAHLAELNVPSLIHYPFPLHRQKAFEEFGPAPCPNADLFCSRVLSLPIHAHLSDVDVGRVVDGVTSFFRASGSNK